MQAPGSQQALADLPLQIDALLDHLPSGVVIHAIDGRIVAANRFACTLLGHGHAELTGRASTAAVWHFIHADGSLMLPSEYPVNRVLRSGRAVADLVVGVPGLPDGRVRWLICNAYPEQEYGDMQRVIVCFADCTDLKYTELELRASEERLRLMLKGSTDAAWDWDLANNKVYYSERWWEMLGYRAGELPADDDMWQRLTHPADMPRVHAFVEELCAGRRQSYGIEFRLRHRDGHFVPVLSRGFVTRDSSGTALRISGMNADLSERRVAEQRIEDLAYFDYLTGLPNRRMLIEEMESLLKQARRDGRHGALLLVDLDNFKLVNDTMGHDAGDLLLRQVAERLRQAVPDGGRLARFGGDEFMLMLGHLGPNAMAAAERAGAAARSVLALLAEPYQLDGRRCDCSSSIGVALFGIGGADTDTLLKQADLAMYRAKADGRNAVRLFDPSMQAAADLHAQMLGALRDGLAQRQFVLFCQPQFGRDGRLCGAEVLVRWQHGERGLVGPGEFIGLAEASGLIVPLGRQVLEESCRLLARWAADPLLGNIKLAVNLSIQQLRDAGFARSVAGLLADTGAPADKLWLEVTESVFAEDATTLIARMHELRALGVQLALDDFGTGYSSLAYLRLFPLAALKIDRSFVHDLVAPNGAPIVDAIVALARKLGLQVIAEGVEQEAQRDYLLDCGCDALQGFLLGRPVPAADFERLYGQEMHENNAPPPA